MRILVADDDPTLRMLLKELLQVKMECEILEASNGEEAWNLLDAGPGVDLCILDMRMPRMGGIELVGRLRADERFRHQRVMVCSGVNERAPILEAVSAGIDGYLLKPFEGETLHSQVRKILERPAAPPPLPALAPMNDVLRRLGTNKETYLRLLKTFTADVADTLEMVRGEWTAELRQDAALRLLSIQGSGTTLGAEMLVSRAASLEQSLDHNEVAARQGKIAALELENRRLIAAAEKIIAESGPAAGASSPATPPAEFIPEAPPAPQPLESASPTPELVPSESNN